MPAAVLDASVLIAILLYEERTKAIEPFLAHDLYMCAVNIAEVAEVSRRKNDTVTPNTIRGYLDRLKIIDVPLSMHLAFVTANFARVTRKKGLSLGDNACLALGKELGADILTTEIKWASLDLRLPIHLIAA